VIADVDEQALERARGAIEAELAGLVAKGRYEEGKARFLASLVHTTTGRAEFAGCELVLEAVFEQLELKQTVFRRARSRGWAELRPGDQHLRALHHRDGRRARASRAAGRHALLQPRRAAATRRDRPRRGTDDATVATAADLTAKLHKRPLLVQDAPAFVVNRILTRAPLGRPRGARAR